MTKKPSKIDRYLAKVKQSFLQRGRACRVQWGEQYVLTLQQFDAKVYETLKTRPEYEARQYDDQIPALLEWLAEQWKGK